MDRVDAVAELAGDSGPVVVRSDDFPVRLDEAGRRRYPYPDFGSDLIDRLFRELPTASRAGPPWARRTACGRCGADRLADADADAEITLAIDLGRVPVFHLHYRLPAARCASCGLEQVRLERSLEFHVAQALADALEAAEVIPG